MRKIYTVMIIMVLATIVSTGQTTKPGWLVTRDMPEGLRGCCSVLLPDGNILISGGINNAGETVKRTYLYLNQDGSVIEVGQMSEGRAYHKLVAFEDAAGIRVFAVGGYSGTSSYSTLTSIEELDYTPGNIDLRWSIAAQMKQGRADFAAALDDNGNLIIGGGFSQTSGGIRLGPMLQSVESFNMGNNSISSLSDMNKGRVSHLLGIILDENGRDKLITASGEGTPETSTELYENNKWSTFTFPPKDVRSFAGALADIGKIARLIGGYDKNYKVTNTCEWYDVKAGWKYAPSMLVPRAKFGMTLIAGTKDTIPSYLIVGGEGSGGQIKDCEYYTLPNASIPSGLWSQFYMTNVQGSERQVTISGSNIPVIFGGNGSSGAIAQIEVFQPLSANDAVFAALETGRISDSIQIIITNNWLLPVTVSNFSIKNEAEFFFTGDTNNFVLQPNASRKLFMYFRPNDIGARSGEFHFNVGPITNTVKLSGNGTKSNIAVMTKNADFGSIMVGTDTTVCFAAIKNTGTDSTYIDSVTVTNYTDYKLISPLGRVKLGPGDSLMVCIMFRPKQSGSLTGTAIINIGQKTYPAGLQGKGLMKYLKYYRPEECDTIPYQPGKTLFLDVKLFNPSDLPVNVDTMIFIGGSGEKFFFRDPIRFTVAEGTYTDVIIGFTPPSEGEFRTSLVVINNGIPDSLTDISLCLVTRSKYLGFAEPSVDFGTVCEGDTLEKEVWFENPSLFDAVIVDTAWINTPGNEVAVLDFEPDTLGPREKMMIKVILRPGLAENYQNSLIINTSSGTSDIPVIAKIIPLCTLWGNFSEQSLPGINMVFPIACFGNFNTYSFDSLKVRVYVNTRVLYPLSVAQVIAGPPLNVSKSRILNIQPNSFDINLYWNQPIKFSSNLFNLNCEILRGDSYLTQVGFAELSNTICVRDTSMLFQLYGICGGSGGLVVNNSSVVYSLSNRVIEDNVDITFQTKQSSNITLKIYSTDGSLLMSRDLYYGSAGVNREIFDCSNIPNGAYLLTIEVSNGLRAAETFFKLK